MADDGVPGDFHFTHLTGKALGGAGLVMTEMTCVSPEGRITPACCGLYDDEQTAGVPSDRRLRARAARRRRSGMQLGHSGRKGSTKRMWEGIDEPLPDGNWEVVGPSPLAYQPGVNQVPRELTTTTSTRSRSSSSTPPVAAATRGLRPDRAALRARLPAVELHLAR